MTWKQRAYCLHRWLGLIVGLQLLAWSGSGLVFSLLDIDNVHGDRERNETPPPPVQWESVGLTPQSAVAAATYGGTVEDEPTSVVLRQHLGRPCYVLYDSAERPRAVVDANTGSVTTRITEDQAVAIARADFEPDSGVTFVRYLDGDPPLEYRGGPMPVYQVQMDHPKQTRIYVSAVTGQVLKRRNEAWRWFDFFWMLHIMDYRQREDFNHPLLTTMSAMAILTSVSGIGLWWWRRPWRHRPRSPGRRAATVGGTAK